MAVPIARRRFTVEDYHRMAEAGILGEDDRVELIAGEIVEMSPMGPRHVDCLVVLNRLLNRLVGDEALVSVQSSIRLANDGEPQPDIALLKPRRYTESLPAVADVPLVIEVADTSLAYDRGVKLPLYAAAGILESWLFDLVGGTIERHCEPGATGYRLIARAGRGESLTSTVMPGVTLSIDAILG